MFTLSYAATSRRTSSSATGFCAKTRRVLVQRAVLLAHRHRHADPARGVHAVDRVAADAAALPDAAAGEHGRGVLPVIVAPLPPAARELAEHDDERVL